MFACWKRNDFIEIREPLPDAEFVRSIGVATGKVPCYALAVRRAIARLCKVPPETIRESDGMRALCNLMFDGWDQLVFVFELESQLGQKLREVPHPAISWRFFCWGRDKDEAFGRAAAITVELPRPCATIMVKPNA